MLGGCVGAAAAVGGWCCVGVFWDREGGAAGYFKGEPGGYPCFAQVSNVGASGCCQASSAVSEATTQPPAKNGGAGPPTAAEARG